MNLKILGKQITTNNNFEIDSVLLEYSYREEGSSIAPPDGFIVYKAPEGAVETGIRIDFLKHEETGILYVIPRGTANLQNAASDLSLAENAQFKYHIDAAANVVKDYIVDGGEISFVGHSYGGNGSSLLAQEVFEIGVEFDLSPSFLQDNISIRTYNSAGVPDASGNMMSNLESIQTNYRLVEDNGEILSNGRKLIYQRFLMVVLLLYGPGTPVPKFMDNDTTVPDLP